jgi:hypothetical protein
MTALSPYLPHCGICHKPVNLEASNTDEVGKAVHQECYHQNVKQPRKSAAAAMIDFLDSVRTPKDNARCPECGSLLQYRGSLSSFFRERTWDVPLPVCPVCNPVPPPLTYHA